MFKCSIMLLCVIGSMVSAPIHASEFMTISRNMSMDNVLSNINKEAKYVDGNFDTLYFEDMIHGRFCSIIYAFENDALVNIHYYIGTTNNAADSVHSAIQNQLISQFNIPQSSTIGSINKTQWQSSDAQITLYLDNNTVNDTILLVMYSIKN